MDALRIIGRMADVDEIIADVLKDQLFYQQSGGGMTLSGGEPFYQSEFAIALLKAGKKAGLHNCVETSGFCPTAVIEEAALSTDLFLFDVKETDAALHKQFTGVDNALILANLCRLSEMGVPVTLRCPIVPSYNVRTDHLKGLAALTNSLKSIVEIHLEPYHPFGVNKYDQLGFDADCKDREFMPAEDVQQVQSFLESLVHVPVRIS